MGLPKLNSVKACVKCRSPSISAAHEKRAEMKYVPEKTRYDRNNDETVIVFEHMIRTCWRCGFQWLEAVLDRKETAE